MKRTLFIFFFILTSYASNATSPQSRGDEEVVFMPLQTSSFKGTATEVRELEALNDVLDVFSGARDVPSIFAGLRFGCGARWTSNVDFARDVGLDGMSNAESLQAFLSWRRRNNRLSERLFGKLNRSEDNSGFVGLYFGLNADGGACWVFLNSNGWIRLDADERKRPSKEGAEDGCANIVKRAEIGAFEAPLIRVWHFSEFGFPTLLEKRRVFPAFDCFDVATRNDVALLTEDGLRSYEADYFMKRDGKPVATLEETSSFDAAFPTGVESEDFRARF